MIPPKKKLEEENVDSWLMSYADMVTLLMSFFVIFVSVSEPKKERISMLSSGMGGKFGTVEIATPFDGVIKSIQGIIEKNQSFRDISVENSDKTVEMEISNSAFFKPSTADIEESKIPLLEEIVKSLKSVDFINYNIIIEGHTSNEQPKSGLYATNWELSGARAARLVRFFIENGIEPKTIRAVGLADTKPKVNNKDINGNPIPQNQEKNERMLIKLERL
ncbi:MAG: OmpA family protein [Rickettsiales bacterium]